MDLLIAKLETMLAELQSYKQMQGSADYVYELRKAENRINQAITSLKTCKSSKKADLFFGTLLQK